MPRLLCPEQFGFRAKESTSLAIFKFLKFITEEINNRKLVGSIYLDFAKAFDSINQGRLSNKLNDMGVPPSLVRWIQNYLKNRKIKTKLNNNISTTAELLCGVPQGSILRPTLFLCYINDLAMLLRNFGVSISLYADDAVIYCANFEQYILEERLKNALSMISDWCNKNFINLNIDKTKFCIYGSRSMVNKGTLETLGSNNCNIKRVQSYHYLGVTLDECLNMKSNFNQIVKKFANKIYQFGKIVKYMNTEIRILVYKQTIMPLVEYVSFTLNLNTLHECEKLQRMQNKALRMCYNIHDPRDVGILNLHTNARIDMLKKRWDNHLLYNV